LGAFLYAALPMQGILAIDVFTALIAISIVSITHIPQPQRDTETKPTFFQDFVAGFRYIVAWRGLLIVLLMVMVINFFYSAAESLTPILISKHFRGTVTNLGIWQAMFAIGTILGGILLGTWGGFKKRVVTAQLGLIVLGLSTMMIGFMPPNFLLFALIINTLSGLVLPIVNGSYGAILQSVIAPEMQGRVFAFILSAASLVSPIGLVIAGPLSDSFGVPLWFRVAGTTCALMGLAGFFIHEVMQMEEEKKGLSPEPSQAGFR
jgi:MFS transporter, DHA3 family, macrolide efflux protein